MQKLPKKLKSILTYLKEKKTISIKVLDIRNISILSDYFVIISADTIRLVETINNDLIDLLQKEGYFTKTKNTTQSKWMLLDYDDVVVHIFEEEYKNLYNLDKLWADAKEVEV